MPGNQKWKPRLSAATLKKIDKEQAEGPMYEFEDSSFTRLCGLPIMIDMIKNIDFESTIVSPAYVPKRSRYPDGIYRVKAGLTVGPVSEWKSVKRGNDPVSQKGPAFIHEKLDKDGKAGVEWRSNTGNNIAYAYIRPDVGYDSDARQFQAAEDLHKRQQANIVTAQPDWEQTWNRFFKYQLYVERRILECEYFEKRNLQVFPRNISEGTVI